MENSDTAGPATVTQPETGYKIAILGTASTSVHDAPYEDKSWKIWNMSANFMHQRRFDLWFEIHTAEILLAASNNNHKYLDFVKGCGPALITGHPGDAWPQATAFPLAEIVERFGDYFTCTAAYMICYAMLLHEKNIKEGGPGVAEIGLWGVDMACEGEYSHQKACAEHYLGWAKGMGIKVTVAPESPILRSNAMYGFENVKLSREFTEKIIQLARDIRQAEVNEKHCHEEVLQLKALETELKSIAHRWQL